MLILTQAKKLQHIQELRNILSLKNTKKRVTMKSEHREESKSLTNAEGEPLKGSYSIENEVKGNLHGELLEREQVGSSPLWIMGNSVDGYFLAIGRQRLSNVCNTKEEVKQLMVDDMWQIIGNYILQLVELSDEAKKRVAEVNNVD